VDSEEESDDLEDEVDEQAQAPPPRYRRGRESA
jgi:hypothetical protein